METKTKRAAYMRAYVSATQERRETNAARAKAWAEANKERARITKRRRDLATRYGITIEEWDAMFAEQGGRCAICGKEAENSKAWHTDHCHSTGKVRGILCRKCNHLLGKAEDNPVILRSAIDYLKRSY